MGANAQRTTPPASPTPTESANRSGLAVVTRDAAAGALLDPTRRRIVAALQSPASATSIAAGLGLSRQLVNYHVRALERAGLVEEVERRPRRGLEERIVRATATHYLLSPAVLDTLGAALPDATDRFSAVYQLAVAARTIREVADLRERAERAGKRLTTMTLDTTVMFATPAAREAFANELVSAVNRLVAKFHDPSATNGRAYRLFAGAHPVGAAPTPSKTRSEHPRRRRKSALQNRPPDAGRGTKVPRYVDPATRSK